MSAVVRAARLGALLRVRQFRRPNQQPCLAVATRHLSSSSSSSSSTSAVVPVDIDERENDNENNLPTKLIDFAISAKIKGEESQVAMVELRPGETLRAESGAMLFMTQGVEMNTDLHGASAAVTRMMTGQNVFLTDFTYKGNNGGKDTFGTVGLGTDFPSKIVRLTLADYQDATLICQKGAFMASNPSVDIQMEFTKSLSAGFFGGQGFILQRLSGQGDVLVKAGGTLVEKDLQEGESLRVSSGSIVAFTSTVDYDIQMMPGIKNAMFGGEGLFVTTLKGPGKVWLQGMPADRMIAEIARRVPSGGLGLGIPLPIGMGGGGGGEAAAGEAAAEGAAGAGGESSEDMVAATDAAVDADRQATVASSGMMGSNDALDADSPSALYGDAAPTDAGASETASEDPFASAGSSSTTGGGDDGFFKETTFTDGDGDTTATTFSDETTFSDDTSFSTNDDFDQPQQEAQGGFWGDDDQTTTDVFDTGGADEAASEGASSIFSTLWDIFTGDD